MHITTYTSKTHVFEENGAQDYLQEVVHPEEIVHFEGGSVLHQARAKALHEVQIHNGNTDHGPW
jgi:hypothetical protein